MGVGDQQYVYAVTGEFVVKEKEEAPRVDGLFVDTYGFLMQYLTGQVWHIPTITIGQLHAAAAAPIAYFRRHRCYSETRDIFIAGEWSPPNKSAEQQRRQKANNKISMPEGIIGFERDPTKIREVMREAARNVEKHRVVLSKTQVGPFAYATRSIWRDVMLQNLRPYDEFPDARVESVPDTSRLEGEISAVQMALKFAREADGPYNAVVFSIDSDVATIVLANYEEIISLPEQVTLWWYDSYKTRKHFVNMSAFCRSFPDATSARAMMLSFMATGTDYTEKGIISPSEYDASRIFFRRSRDEIVQYLNGQLIGHKSGLRDGDILYRQWLWIERYYRSKDGMDVPHPCEGHGWVDVDGICWTEGLAPFVPGKAEKRDRAENSSDATLEDCIAFVQNNPREMPPASKHPRNEEQGAEDQPIVISI